MGRKWDQAASSRPPPSRFPSWTLRPQGLGFLTSPNFSIRLSLQDPHGRGGSRETRGPVAASRAPYPTLDPTSRPSPPRLRQRTHCSGAPGTKPRALFGSASLPRASRLALLTCSAAAGAGGAAERLQARRGAAAEPEPPRAKPLSPRPGQASCARSRSHSVLCSPTHRRPLRPRDPDFTRAMPWRTAGRRNRAAPGAGRVVAAGADGAAAPSAGNFALCRHLPGVLESELGAGCPRRQTRPPHAPRPDPNPLPAPAPAPFRPHPQTRPRPFRLRPRPDRPNRESPLPAPHQPLPSAAPDLAHKTELAFLSPFEHPLGVICPPPAESPRSDPVQVSDLSVAHLTNRLSPDLGPR